MRTEMPEILSARAIVRPVGPAPTYNGIKKIEGVENLLTYDEYLRRHVCVCALSIGRVGW